MTFGLNWGGSADSIGTVQYANPDTSYPEAANEHSVESTPGLVLYSVPSDTDSVYISSGTAIASITPADGGTDPGFVVDGEGWWVWDWTTTPPSGYREFNVS